MDEAAVLLLHDAALAGAPGPGAEPFLTSSSTVAPICPTSPGHGCILALMDGVALHMIGEAVPPSGALMLDGPCCLLTSAGAALLMPPLWGPQAGWPCPQLLHVLVRGRQRQHPDLFSLLE